MALASRACVLRRQRLADGAQETVKWTWPLFLALADAAEDVGAAFTHIECFGMQVNHELVVEPIGLELEKLSRPLDFTALFGNDRPVELEIGMGKGTFLTDQARARPHVNFFGIEWARWYWKYASDRLRRNACFNARTVRADASYFLSEYVPDASLSVIHIYFPDPWPKKRHHKRRLIQEPFIRQTERALAPGGRLQIVTDHQDYFEQIEAVLGASRLRVVEFARPASASQAEVVGSNFERKYRREGRPFYATAAVRAQATER